MKILVLGNTAKEHALLKWLCESEEEKELFVYPGNPGMSEYAHIVKQLGDNKSAVIDCVKKNHIDLIVSSTGRLIEEGINEDLKALGAEVIGPGRDAYTYENLQTLRKRASDYGIKTLEKAKIANTMEELESALSQFKNRMVALKCVKGRGRDRCDTSSFERAVEWAKNHIDNSPILIEEFIEGLTATATILTDGTNYRLLPIACDYDRSKEDNEGSFSSGMGALAPLPLSKYTRDRVGEEVIKKMINGLKNDKIVYKGFMTFHLLITSSGDVYLLNMKTRLSDPSAAAMLSLVKDDGVRELKKAMQGKLEPVEFNIDNSNYALDVVIASLGYPDKDLICKEHIDKRMLSYARESLSKDMSLFFGAVSEEGNEYYTNGGRPFTLVVKDSSIERTNRKAYSFLYSLSDLFPGAWYRSDIGANFFIF